MAHFLRHITIEPLLLQHRRSVMARELKALGDHILEDIGISRYQIPAVVARACQSVTTLTRAGCPALTLA